MFFDHKAFWLAKDARAPGEFQDAWQADPLRGIAAIADGVSSSLMAASWAKLLVEGVVEQPPPVGNPAGFSQWLAERRRRWSESFDPDALAWHQKARLREGAAATLLWVRLSPCTSADPASDDYHLTAHALGDCCLFHVRNGQVLRAFPIEDSGAFDQHPEVLRSVFHKQEADLQFDTLEDSCRAGDLVVLCTDAVAAWALVELESGASPQWDEYWKLTQPGWEHTIGKLREAHRIRYDDSTVVLLKITDTR